MQLFLQLHCADLPTEHQKLFDGLLQLFVCTTQTDADCNSYEPFAHGNLVRVIPPNGNSTQISKPAWDTYSPVGICGWQACDDHPSAQELEDRYGEEISRDLEDQIMELCVSGEKLLGWPSWDQNVAYPACPVCQSKMQFIFQMPSDHILPFMFGDGGTGWITQCPAHPEQMTFSWDS